MNISAAAERRFGGDWFIRESSVTFLTTRESCSFRVHIQCVGYALDAEDHLFLRNT